MPVIGHRDKRDVSIKRSRTRAKDDKLEPVSFASTEKEVASEIPSFDCRIVYPDIPRKRDCYRCVAGQTLEPGISLNRGFGHADHGRDRSRRKI